MERVQPYASVDARKRLEPGVAEERYKPIIVWTGLYTPKCHDGGSPSSICGEVSGMYELVMDGHR